MFVQAMHTLRYPLERETNFAFMRVEFFKYVQKIKVVSLYGFMKRSIYDQERWYFEWDGKVIKLPKELFI